VKINIWQNSGQMGWVNVDQSGPILKEMASLCKGDSILLCQNSLCLVLSSPDWPAIANLIPMLPDFYFHTESFRCHAGSIHQTSLRKEKDMQFRKNISFMGKFEIGKNAHFKTNSVNDV
jgi:hypothetical protein